MTKQVDNSAKKFTRGMKNGFINMFVLLVLEKGPNHGYNIKKEISDRTLDVWSPTASSLYPLLNRMCDSGLIKEAKNQDEDENGRIKKIYEITSKGKKTLKLMLKKQRQIEDAMKTLMMETIKISDDFTDGEIEALDIDDYLLDWYGDLPDKEKEKKLKVQQYFRKQEIERNKRALQRIEEELQNLNKKK